jgi:hypothetical protein
LAFKIKKRPEDTGGTGIGTGLTSHDILADTAAGYGKRMPKQIQVAGYEARVRVRRQGDDNSALPCRLKRSEGGIPHLGKQVEDDKTVERLVNEFAAKAPKLEFSPADISGGRKAVI